MNNSSKLTIPILILFVSNLSSSVLAQTDSENELISGKEVNKTISADENHIYTVDLENGMAIIGKVAQKGIDLVVDVYKPNGQLQKQIDSPNGTEGDEPFDITANQSGKYKFVIHSLEKDYEKGDYTLKVEQIFSLSENTKRITKRELPTETLYNLWESSLTDGTAVETFIANHSERHIIEPIEGNDKNMLVTYFCIPHENTEYVMLSGGPDFLGLRFQRLPNSKLHFVTQRVPNDARFNYGFNYFNLDKMGPNNEIESRYVLHAYDGTIEMPNAPKQIYISERENVEKGTLLSTSIKSQVLNEERKLTIHTPANYNPNESHHLLIVFDGEAYGANRRPRVPTPTIMDNLMADKKIPATVTVLVWSMGKRSKDLISEKFGDFIATELIPRMRSEYNIHPESDKVILAGSSRGGFAASFIALNHSDVIGNVLSQSGSYWIKGTKNENHWIYPEDDGKLIPAYKNSKRLPIKFYMDIGLYDAGASMLGSNRQFRDILMIKGYDVDYREFKGGHNYVNWRGTLADGIISLIGLRKE
ncbi:alpha/beta hydrolase-fold protein [Muricauda sp. 334s03]|uniref:Alpha/beta hydrolase-fold protein n=1 Tax=Flagellimonas yonaguniensis TaxID=3031325 RepID=A0ABT5XXK4_9FLAO|nr:alpha/beta hydrolase-fold protein [[Muricauda] yonaguniensis]MDF0715859.1 alpha/beta hydrolase-fold protein [[Muricauda] yonaguniensis]